MRPEPNCYHSRRATLTRLRLASCDRDLLPKSSCVTMALPHSASANRLRSPMQLPHAARVDAVPPKAKPRSDTSNAGAMLDCFRFPMRALRPWAANIGRAFQWSLCTRKLYTLTQNLCKCFGPR